MAGGKNPLRAGMRFQGKAIEISEYLDVYRSL